MTFIIGRGSHQMPEKWCRCQLLQIHLWGIDEVRTVEAEALAARTKDRIQHEPEVVHRFVKWAEKEYPGWQDIKTLPEGVTI